jgi:agmatine deiminase
MKALILAALLGYCATAATADQAAVLSDAYLATIQDDGPSLPRGLTPEEKLIWRLPPVLAIALAPPPQPVRTPAEYEGNDGLLMRWGSYNSVITEISVAVTRASARLGGPDPWVFLVVSSSTQQSSAAQTLAAAGTNMARVRFIVAPSNTVWIRDYGPRFVNSAGIRGLIDHTYNRPRPQDDAMPSAVSTTFEAPTYALPLTHGGGNFHLFDDGQAFMTRLISNENPVLSEAQIKSYFRDYQGLDVTLTEPFPSSFDSTQHIDMWMLPAARRSLIVSEYPATGGIYTVPRRVTEEFSLLMQERGYQVFRTPGWSNGAHYTYANAVVMNSQVLICRFNGEDARNAQALAEFQKAFPGREISTIDCSALITAAGAIHCIVMHVSTPIIAINGFED